MSLDQRQKDQFWLLWGAVVLVIIYIQGVDMNGTVDTAKEQA